MNNCILLIVLYTSDLSLPKSQKSVIVSRGSSLTTDKTRFLISETLFASSTPLDNVECRRGTNLNRLLCMHLLERVWCPWWQCWAGIETWRLDLCPFSSVVGWLRRERLRKRSKPRTRRLTPQEVLWSPLSPVSNHPSSPVVQKAPSCTHYLLHDAKYTARRGPQK